MTRNEVDVVADHLTAVANKVDVVADHLTAVANKVDVVADHLTAVANKVDVVADHLTAVATKVDVVADHVTRLEQLQVDKVVPAISALQVQSQLAEKLAVAMWGEPNNGGGLKGDARTLRDRINMQERFCNEVQTTKRSDAACRTEKRWKWRGILYPAVLTMVATILAGWGRPVIDSLLASRASPATHVTKTP